MINSNRLTKSIIIFISVILLIGTVGLFNSVDAAAKPKSMTIATNSKTVDIKGQVKVRVKSVKPKKASKKVTYKSSNKNIATVSKSGVVTGKKAGKVKITVRSKTNKKLKKTITITVKNLNATNIAISSRGTTLPVGYTSYISATAKGNVGYYNQGVEWYSNTPEIATVTKEGIVTAVSEGQANLIVKERNGSYSKTCTITVASQLMDGMTNIKFGKFYWSVLETKSDKSLLICDSVIQNTTFNDKNYSATWGGSGLRLYLNNQFLNTYFSPDEINRIVRNTNSTPDNIWYATYGGSNVLDYFCPLSVEEVLKYYGDSGRYSAGKPSGTSVISDKYNSARICKSGTKASAWWLRTLGNEANKAMYVGSDGKIYVVGDKNTASKGLRPTVWVSNVTA